MRKRAASRLNWQDVLQRKTSLVTATPRAALSMIAATAYT
jgi:hypothetical protein